MIQQAKQLKALLKKHGITDDYGRLSVRTNKHGECWAEAESHVRALTDAEVDALEADDKYVFISNHPEYNFAIVWSAVPRGYTVPYYYRNGQPRERE